MRWKDGRIYFVAAAITVAVWVVLTKAYLLVPIEHAATYAADAGIALALVSGVAIGWTFWEWIKKPPPS